LTFSITVSYRSVMEITKEYLALAEAIREHGEPPCATTDPEMYFPPKGMQASIEIRMAKALCDTCPVKTECLTYALEANEPYGIWGGLTTNERDRLKRKR
jgi:WhiB family redox-sensing transcriptional regulator